MKHCYSPENRFQGVSWPYRFSTSLLVVEFFLWTVSPNIEMLALEIPVASFSRFRRKKILVPLLVKVASVGIQKLLKSNCSAWAEFLIHTNGVVFKMWVKFIFDHPTIPWVRFWLSNSNILDYQIIKTVRIWPSDIFAGWFGWGGCQVVVVSMTWTSHGGGTDLSALHSLITLTIEFRW